MKGVFMFGLFSPKAIPAAREVSVMKTLGLLGLEFPRQRKIEHDLNNLRDTVYNLIDEIIRDGTDASKFSTVDIEPEAVLAMCGELNALGYEVKQCPNEVKFGIPQKKAA
jgi:hypothetical protein